MKGKIAILILASLVFSSAIFAQKTRELTQEEDNKKASQKRVALVIGNGAYTKAKPLPNPSNDAADMAQTLRDLGFEVISGVNQNKRQTETLIREFGTKLAASGGIGLFYYAGHGIQVGGENYIVPVDADIPEEDEVAYSAVPISLVLAKMQTAKNDLNIVILDACRNNPFARSWRSFRDNSNSDGLAKISPPTGTLVLYATEPGKVASDGTGRNGLFTEALLKQLKQPNMEYDQMVRAISSDVWQKSNKQQLPWKEGNSLKEFYFSGKPDKNAKSNVVTIPEPVKTVSLPSVDELLNDYFKAVGFEKAKNINTFVLKGSVDLDYNGQKITGRVESYIKLPGKQATINKFSNGVITKDIFDGENGWINSNTGGTKNATSQQINLQKRQMALIFGDIVALKSFYVQMTIKSREKIDNKEVFVMEIVSTDNQTEKIYFDAATKLIYGWDFPQTSVATQAGISFMSEIRFDNFVNLNGLQFPLTIKQKVSAGISVLIRYGIGDISFGITVDDKLFKKP